MGVLLDSNIVIPLIEGNERRLPTALANVAMDAGQARYFSTASLWEIAIKVRLGKLKLTLPLEGLPEFVVALGARFLMVQPDHAIRLVSPGPPTRDPFDRLLLAQCACEGLRLVTIDRALAAHPLA
jgi:PIN domain nuclease of toxin-antitoxin system